MRLKLKSLLIRLFLASFLLYLVYVSFLSGPKSTNKKRAFPNAGSNKEKEYKIKNEPDMHYDDNSDNKNIVKNHPIHSNDVDNNKNKNEQINEVNKVRKRKSIKKFQLIC